MEGKKEKEENLEKKVQNVSVELVKVLDYEYPVLSVYFDRGYLITGSLNLEIFDVKVMRESEREMREIKVHSHEAVVTGTLYPGAWTIQKVKTGRDMALKVIRHSARVYDADLHKNHLITTGGYRVRVFDINEIMEVRRREISADSCSIGSADYTIEHPIAYGVSLDGKYLVTGSADGALRIFDFREIIERPRGIILDASRTASKVIKHSHDINGVDLYKNYLVTGSRDNKLRIFDIGEIMRMSEREISSDEALKVIEHPNEVEKVHLNGRYLISGCEDRNLRMFDFDEIMKIPRREISSDEAFKVIEHPRSVVGVYLNEVFRVSPGLWGEYLISGCRDGKLRVFKIETEQE